MSPAHALSAAGPVKRIARVGMAPLGEDDPIEILFESGALFHIDVGFQDASDIEVGEGPLLERVYGHLRREEPAAFDAIAREWTDAEISLPWLLGAPLQSPRRLTMTRPYRLDVGYAFDAGGRIFALFGEADYITACEFGDPEVARLGLEIGAAV